MTAAVIQAQVLHGPDGSPTYQSAEAGLVWNRSDDELATQRVPVPAAIPGSNYSNYKACVLNVTIVGTTVISNLTYRRATVEPLGTRFFALQVAPSTYTQCTGDGGAQGNRPPDSTAPLAASPDPNTPVGYIPFDSSSTAYDTTPVATTSTGPKGKLLQVVVGVSHLYGDDPSAAAPLPSTYMSYDEA